MKALRADVLSFEYRLATLKFSTVEEAGSIGKDPRINGLKTSGGHKFSVNHPANVLIYTIADGEDTTSLQGASQCKVEWN